MPKTDTTKLRVGVMLEDKSSLGRFTDPKNPWVTIDLHPAPKQNPALSGLEISALELWKKLNEEGLEAVVVELDDRSLGENLAILGWALARAWHVILIEDTLDPFLLGQLPWVTRVGSVDGALSALDRYSSLRKALAEKGELAPQT